MDFLNAGLRAPLNQHVQSSARKLGYPPWYLASHQMVKKKKKMAASMAEHKQ
jgi:hypothetical protein